MPDKLFPPSLPWDYRELMSMMPDFADLYAKRPIKDNTGGMKAPHMFAFFCFLKKLKPDVVIESGVWLGQGTWLIEQVLPEADVHCIDLDLSRRQYISQRAKYYDKDFEAIDWSHIADKKRALLFFDDHQNALDRLRFGISTGFKDFIFEDNYPATRGDCYSLKKAFDHAGFRPDGSRGLKTRLKDMLGMNNANQVKPNAADARYLNENLEIYYEFPPAYKAEATRWGDPWTEANYPTPEPLLKFITDPSLSIFRDEAVYYTWMCFARLK